MHGLAWGTFVALTGIAEKLHLYEAGQDLLASAFSGNIRGAGPGVAELEIEERPSEPFIVFAADKTDSGAWNLPLFRIFCDPFNTAGLVIDSKMHAGFAIEVHDVVVEHKAAVFETPAETYDLLVYIGTPSRFVIKHVFRHDEREQPVAVASTSRLSLIAGRYVGKDDPIMIVRCQSGPPVRRTSSAPRGSVRCRARRRSARRAGVRTSGEEQQLPGTPADGAVTTSARRGSPAGARARERALGPSPRAL